MALIRKLLMITGSFSPMPCGVGDYSAKLVNALALQGDWEITVLTDCRASVGTTLNGITLLPCIRKWGWHGIAKLIQLVREQRPDIVHIQYPTAGYNNANGIHYLPLLLRLVGIKVVQTWHEPTSRLRYLANAFASTLIVVPEPDYEKRVQYYYRYLISHRLRYIPVAAAIPRSNISDSENNQLRSKFGSNNRLLVYFGFAVPMKGIEQIFEVADPHRDVIILICSLDPNNSYHNKLLRISSSRKWHNRVVVTGFISAKNVADLLAVADAALFPFIDGVGMRNTSVLAARSQGTFTLTTSNQRKGYVASENVYYVSPGDHGAMRSAIDKYAGYHHNPSADENKLWKKIAKDHSDIYQEVLKF